MKRVLILLMSLAVLEGYGQGRFFFSNSAARTRLWSIDGPLAGPGIWGQFFVLIMVCHLCLQFKGSS
jgi:hypothetical protein